MRFYTVDQLGPNRHLTPEGFLLCKDVAIGRTGEMLYLAGEVPVAAGPDGLVHIARDADSVFHDDTIASFQGKPITMDHPPGDVNPSNWCDLAKGHVQHVRRGDGSSGELLLADLLITDASAIKSVRDGLRQVSCGYDAEYETIAPGSGRQRNIIGNHVALVEKGRCGERCAIGDKENQPMSKLQTTWKDKLRNIFHANDAVSFETLLKDMPEPTAAPAATADGALTLDAVAQLFTDFRSEQNKRFAKIEKRLKVRDSNDPDEDDTEEEKERKRKKKLEEEEEEREREEEEEERKRKKAETEDKLPTRDSIQDVYARAEILSPGIKLPTSDAMGTPGKVRDSLCALRRQALAKYADSEGGRTVVLPFVGSAPDFSKMTCDAVSNVFTAASEIAKRENNNYTLLNRDSIQRVRDQRNKIAEINQKNKEWWDAHSSR